MQVAPYRPDAAPAVTESYNRTFAHVPLCYPVYPEAMAAAAASPDALDRDPPLQALAAFVAGEGSDVRGFIQAGVQPPEHAGGTGLGMIRFFWYEAGRRAVGQALLEAAEAHLRRRGVERVEAFYDRYKFPFCQMRPCYLSDSLGHMQALLLANGYDRVAGEVVLAWPDFEPVDPGSIDGPIEVAVQWREASDRRPTATVNALKDGRRIGQCLCVRVADYADDERARDWFFTIWLGVDDEFQGRGLGKHLLRRALVEMRAAGCRHAAISTREHNHRAFLFYTNFGYRVADWTHGFGRSLAGPPGIARKGKRSS
jgi:ribosomal protein S18 acetylase RimI-like enzyme